MPAAPTTLHPRQDLDVRDRAAERRDPAARTSAAQRPAAESRTERPAALDERSLLCALVESSDDAIFAMDLDGRILSWSRGAEAIFGYAATEAVGEHMSMLVPHDRLDELRLIMAKLARGERTDHLETVRVHKDRKRINVELTVAPITDAHGHIAAASAIAREVTDRKRAEAELRRSNEELEQFAYAASHDLSEPLRVIAGFVELLDHRYSGKLDEEADRFIAFTVAGVERMRAVIDDLLAYSRVGRVALGLAQVNVGELVGEVLQGLMAAIAERATSVEVRALPSVRAEPVLLRLLFQNLIGNAIKFATGEQPHVLVSAAREHGRWRFYVQDNGPGIDPRHARRIFEMFQRLHPREVPGTGIGLAIAKRIVERHGGEIGVVPAPGGGSTFHFTIPDDPERGGV
jgi:PAS domain S-box-containing protein